MFVEVTNLLHLNRDINTVFLNVNDRIQNLNEWFISNKLSLNMKKIAQTQSLKFLGVLLDENLSWKTHKRYIENNISTNIGILFKSRPFLKVHSFRFKNLHIFSDPFKKNTLKISHS